MRFGRARWWLFTLAMPLVVGIAFLRCSSRYGDDTPDAGESAASDASGLGDAPTPSLWQGPAVGLFSTDGGVGPACPSDLPQRTELFANPSAAAATCDQCACGKPTIECGGLFQIYPTGQCKSGSSCDNANGSQACNPSLPGCGNYAALGVGRVDRVPGNLSCESTGADAGARAPISWGSRVALCGGATAPAPTAGGPPVCIWHAGADTSCPSEYPTHHLFYASADDQRGCTCTCGGAGMAYCIDVKPVVYAAAACGGTTKPLPIPTDGGCVLLPSDHDAASFAFLPTSVEYVIDNPSCAPSGTAIGAALPSSPTTVCCAP